jgi:hypothetical protein
MQEVLAAAVYLCVYLNTTSVICKCAAFAGIRAKLVERKGLFADCANVV